ncbi:conserved hypothetical protein [Planktothrix sp. PCC 11201]|uniref:hypothetical protein n=1 Tax=Planktothrix sp. PCC 11201 TaxID=1729650 RepID=UPI000923CA17|nr:hypothetical protein [Planktothrix sp. PCC 11201]SKB14877.1 conserved hypothetical protein [Planktothrix sp. PCC 11201]
MNIPSTLNVAIGLFFIYLLLSLLISEIQEFLASSIFDWRAKNLYRSIQFILGNSAAKLLYQYPLIKSWKDYKQRVNKNSVGPSYIPNSTFALALISVIIEKSGVQPEINSLTIDDFILAINSEEIKQFFDPDQIKLFKILAIKTKNKAGDTANFESLETAISDWFEQSMTRASGVYKRQVKLITLAIGFVVAMGLNADTLNITNRLFQEPVLQENLSQSINIVLTNNPNSPLNNCLNSEVNSTKDCQDLTENFLYSYLFDFSSLPLGWTQSNLNQQFNSRENIVIQLFKVIGGWGLTAIAISMGSSFWFDLLNKLINVRNTGSKPQS